MKYLEDLGPYPFPVSIPWLGASQPGAHWPDTPQPPDPDLAVEVYQADEQILKFLPVRWCRWDRSVFFLFIDIKNVPRNARQLSLYLYYTRARLGKRFKNPAPAAVEGYQEWRYLYSEVGTTNEA